MGFMKGFIAECVELLVWLGNSEVCKLTSFFLLHSLVLFSSVEAVKELWTEEKRQGYLYTQVLPWSLWLFRGVECFLEPVEIVGSSQTRRLKNIRELSFANYKLMVRYTYLCSCWYVRLRLLLVVTTGAKFGTQQDVLFSLVAERKCSFDWGVSR